MKTLTFLLAAALFLPAAALPLTVLPWDETVAERELALGKGDKTTPLPYLHPDARSQPVKLPADPAGTRLFILDRKDDEGRPLELPLRFPTGAEQPLLLLLPDPDSAAGLRPFIVEDAAKAFPWGSFRLFNVTPDPLAFRWDKLAKRLKPGWSPVLVEPEGPSRNLEVFLYKQADLEKPIYTAVWEHRQDMRQLVFVVPSEDRSIGPYRFKIIPELRLPEPEEPNEEG